MLSATRGAKRSFASFVRFSDDPITAKATPIRARHLAELRLRIDGLRARYNVPPYDWTDGTLLAGITTVRFTHVEQLREALAAAYRAANVAVPSFEPLAAGAIINASHINEIRSFIAAIE